VNSEVDLANRFFIKTGLMPNPNLWIVLPGCPSRSGPGFISEYMPNERVMARRLVEVIEDIREVDPGAFITLCAAGRATRYLTTLGLLLGINIRMGMEDTVWRYPHKDEKIKNNVDELLDAIAVARLLGREVMTPNEYRQTVGLKPRFDRLPE
jgi:3-keto-5-aminohexanoate cleavage enzyme